MAVKTQKNVTPVLAAAFLKIADNREIEIHEIEGLGKIGIKRLSIGARDSWLEQTNDSQIYLLQRTVCDPDTGELVLDKIDVERLKDLPANIAEDIGMLVFKQNGFKTVKSNSSESEELKNSEASLN